LSTSQPLVINGWSIFVHPFFLKQIQELLTQVERLHQKDPKNYRSKNATKRLAAIAKLALEVIPQDPTRSEYRQGTTLSDEYKHWFRDKFFQQYRLFFRYHQEGKIIVLAWVNDEASKRAYESNTDAYRVFKKMLEKGNPPDSWEALLHEAQQAAHRFKETVDTINKII
jgi:toxin YhaV